MNTAITENKIKVKEGYKQTEIGVIPEEWEVQKMRDISTVNQGLQIPISKRFLEKEPNTYFYLTNEFLKEGTKKHYYIKNPPVNVICNKEDILMTRTGNTGTVVTGVEGAFHNNFFKIKYDKELLYRDYLYSFLACPKTKFNLLVLAGNSTIPDLNHSEFYKLKLPIPPLPEQKAIADCLSTWDKAIEKLSALIDSKKEQKRGLMQQLLTGKKRLEGFTDEWIYVKIGDLGDTFNGLSGKTKTDFGQGKPYVTYLNVFRQNKIDENTEFDYVKVGESENQSTLNYGDLIFTTSSETPNEVGMSSVITFHPKEKLYLNSFCFSLRLKNLHQLDPIFAVFLLRGSEIRKEMYKLAQGSTRFNLSKSSFKNIEVKLPTIIEQNAIAEVLIIADKEIELLEKKLNVFKNQKKGLLQVLLTGEKRLIN